jgi:uncharacterized protein YjbJ (UPF0337 family)
MAYWLKQSTAATIALGPFVDSTDGVTAETALTISQADIRLSKNGGAFAQTNNATGATHMEAGYYSVPLDTTDTNTLGRLKLCVSESGALPTWIDLHVVPANVWDSFFGADKLEVDVLQFGGTNGTNSGGRPEVNATHAAGTAWNSGAIGAATLASDTITAAKIATDAITAAKIADGAIDAATFAAGAINAAAIAADAITDAKVASDVTIASVTGAVGSVTGAVGSVTGNVGGNVAGTVASVVGAVGSVTGNVGGNVVGSVGSVTGLTASDVGAIKLVTDKLDATIEQDTGGTRFTTEALENAPTGGSAPSAAAIADAVWDEVRADHTTSGTFGQGAASVQGNVTGSVASVTGAVGSVTGAVASVTGNVGGNVTGSVGSVVGAVGSVTGNVGGNVTGSVGSVTGLTASDVGAIKIVTDRVNETLEDDTAGTSRFTTHALANGPSGSGASAADIADAVWDEAIAGHLTAGSTGDSLNNATAAGNPWAAIIEGTLTAEDILRILVGVAAGKTEIDDQGGGAAEVTFRDVTDSSDIVVAQMQGSERQSVTVTP